MSDVLAITERRGTSLRGVSHEVVSAARTLAEGLGGGVHALVLGDGVEGPEALGRYGADRILVAAGEHLGGSAPELDARAVAETAQAGAYGAVVFAATAGGKDLAPRVAALLDAPLATDVVEVGANGGAVTGVRPVYAGKAFARVSFASSPALLSIRPNVLPAQERSGAGEVERRSLTAADGTPSTRVVEVRAAEGGALDVAEATMVVSGGRGMKGPEHWKVLENLRDAMGPGAALGASRAVVDAGWRPHGEQVGQTGKTVAPKLYVAVGISGAIQHLAGMRTAGTIVAINKDPDAPIFQVADYGIVGDAFEVVPALADAVRELLAD